MSDILKTKCDDSKIAIALDDLSCPHCVWVDGGSIKYARHYGGEWRLAGGQAVVHSSEDPLSLSKYCVGFTADRECFFAFMEGQDLKVCTWDGSGWSVETAWEGAGSHDVLAFAVAWDSFPVVAAFTRDYGNRSIWVTDKWGGPWGVPQQTLAPAQDNDLVELKAAKVAGFVYLFWNGRSESLGQTWIGHVAWDTEARTWLASPTKKVTMSIAEGEIAGLDFATAYEAESSSSSSTP